MPKEEWGVKRLCPACATRFYDLQNDPMTCPSCGHVFDLASLTDSKSKSSFAKEDKTADVKDDDLTDDVDVLDDDDEDGADVDLGDDILDDDDDDDVSLDEIADVATNDDDD